MLNLVLHSSFRLLLSVVTQLTCEQFYLMASALVFGVEALALIETKYPVWYPYYGTWLIAIVVELALLILPNVFRYPESLYDFVFVTIRALRASAFIALSSLYFGLRNDKKQYDNSDAERQSLLSKTPKVSSSEDTVSGSNGYGTTTAIDTQTSDAADESDAGSEDSWLEEQRKVKELISKRLNQDGNWFTYAKGFSVSHQQGSSMQVCLLICLRYSSHMYGLHVARLFSSGLS